MKNTNKIEKRSSDRNWRQWKKKKYLPRVSHSKKEGKTQKNKTKKKLFCLDRFLCFEWFTIHLYIQVYWKLVCFRWFYWFNILEETAVFRRACFLQTSDHSKIFANKYTFEIGTKWPKYFSEKINFSIELIYYETHL